MPIEVFTTAAIANAISHMCFFLILERSGRYALWCFLMSTI